MKSLPRLSDLWRSRCMPPQTAGYNRISLPDCTCQIPAGFPVPFSQEQRHGWAQYRAKPLRPHAAQTKQQDSLARSFKRGDEQSQDAKDGKLMRLALYEAEEAGKRGEVPVGAVLVYGDEVVCCTHNDMESTGDPTQHAELIAIQKAVARIGKLKLPESTLYVTLEPCPMCAGALLQARVGRVVYGARNPLLGADGSWMNLLRRGQETAQLDANPMEESSSHPFFKSMKVQEGVLAAESSHLLKSFFKVRRKLVRGSDGYVREEPYQPSGHQVGGP